MVLACLLAEFDLSVCGELVTGGIGINLSVLGGDYITNGGHIGIQVLSSLQQG